MDLVVLFSFLLFMLIFAGVGLSSVMVKENNTDDYLVASRGIHPALAALSAVSTWNSGYMFIGFIGFMWLMGYSAIWIATVSTFGQLFAWIWIFKRIQSEGKERNVRSLSSLVAKIKGAPEAKLAAFLSVVFLLIYAAAQLSSGGKALFAMLGWNESVGIIIGYILVILYCTAGGIRASIWTDAAQSCVMIVGSSILCYVAMSEVGWFSGLHETLKNTDPDLVSLTPKGLRLGLSMWIFSFFLGGMAVAGQPQVVSRIMTLESDKDRKQACIWFFVWQTPFIILMVLIGLSSRAIFPVESGFDPELALPKLAMDILDPFWVGVILASIFAATMSTADSQVLACTAAITDDLFPSWAQDHKKAKLTTITMAMIATAISLFAYLTNNNSVFSLVVLAVYGLGSMFVPLLILRFLGYQPTTAHSCIMMLAALVGVVGWRILGLNNDVFDTVPGMSAAIIAHFTMLIVNKDPWLEHIKPTKNQLVTWGSIVLSIIVSMELYYYFR
ncbi:MAG: sodium/proline symporter [Candidatus Poseidoniaceae archaeon]|jgi:sodium/proline symporter|nr:sodium/proline symporter [Candidatus Poseidoniaceae archaeon]